MKEKGFTLIELLVVLVIIIMLGSLVFASIIDKGDQFKDIAYKKFEDMIETAAKSYVSKNDNLTNSLKKGNPVVVKLTDLINEDLLSKEDLKNPKTYEEIDIEKSNVIVSYSNYNYTYIVNLNNSKGAFTTEGLVLYLDGNNHGSNSSIWKDQKNNYKVQLKNFSNTTTSGWNGNGLVLDGEDDGIYFGDQLKDLFKSNFTIEIVVRFNDSGRAIILGNYNNSNSIGLEKGSGSDTTYQKGRLYYNAGSVDQLTSNQYYESGNTMSILYTFDKNSGKFSFGKNGKIYETITDSELTSNYDFVDSWIGRDTRSGTTCMAGTIYLIKIYNRVLSSDELQKNYLVDKALYID